MDEYEYIRASDDPLRYAGIYNRHTKFAPYAIPLTPDLMDTHILKEYGNGNQLCLIGKGRDGEGILHAGKYRNEELDGGREIGLVYLLLADGNRLAESLLRKAEVWFAGCGIQHIRACNWRPTPYKYVLHGAETYVWGGFVTALNAYRRLGYDLQDESVIMMCKLDREPDVPVPGIPGLSFSDEPAGEDELTYRGIVRAQIEGREAGHCSYDYLKAISAHFKKPTGQIAIGIDESCFGKGLGLALLMSAHRSLYRLGARQVMLHTVQRLFRAIKLYEKAGYAGQDIRGYCYEKEF